MQLDELRSRLRTTIGNPLAVELGDTELDKHLNDAYTQISNRYRFHKARRLCILTTIANESRYNLPTDAAVVLRTRLLETGKKLTKVDDRQASAFPTVESGVTVIGVPTKYIRYRGYLQFEPVPDGEYHVEVYYKFALPRMTGVGDSPAIPESWHLGIVKLAKHLYYDDQGDAPKAKLAADAYDYWLERQPVEVDEEKVDLDSGVSFPVLTDLSTSRLDFNHEDP